jgi:hypothetical protein
MMMSSYSGNSSGQAKGAKVQITPISLSASSLCACRSGVGRAPSPKDMWGASVIIYRWTRLDELEVTPTEG